MTPENVLDPQGQTIHWDRRNGYDSYPYPHNVTHAWQQCPACLATVRVLELASDYYPAIAKCQCGESVRCPGVEGDGRFSGLQNITRAAEGSWPVIPGEVPVNCSELVREEFESMARTEIFG